MECWAALVAGPVPAALTAERIDASIG